MNKLRLSQPCQARLNRPKGTSLCLVGSAACGLSRSLRLRLTVSCLIVPVAAKVRKRHSSEGCSQRALLRKRSLSRTLLRCNGDSCTQAVHHALPSYRLRFDCMTTHVFACTAAHQAQALAQGRAGQDEARAASVQHGHAPPQMMTGVMIAGVTTHHLRLPLPLPRPGQPEPLRRRRSWTMTTGIIGNRAMSRMIAGIACNILCLPI